MEVENTGFQLLLCMQPPMDLQVRPSQGLLLPLLCYCYPAVQPPSERPSRHGHTHPHTSPAPSLQCRLTTTNTRLKPLQNSAPGP